MKHPHSSILVIGSVNLDMVATVSQLPSPGETVTDASLARYPGGKGANQALAAHRLGARVTFSASVGRDAEAEDALALLRQSDVDLTHCVALPDTRTGIAMISVEESGENQIVVASGANALHRMPELDLSAFDAVICQLETPVSVVSTVSENYDGFLCVNLAPAKRVPDCLVKRADLLVVNEVEAEYIGTQLDLCSGWVATTKGKEGAVLSRSKTGVETETVYATPPHVDSVDTTGAGDTFTAALVLRLVEGADPESALAFACAAGACSTTGLGAQPSLPLREDVNTLLGSL